MRKEGIQIGRIYGIPIFLHTSWFIIFGLIAFSFVSEFDALQLNLPTSRLWGLGLMTSLLFFGSLVFHEMAHSVIAKHYKIPVVSITLFVFGGVSRIGREPARALEEFNIAVAGPLSSLLLAGGFWLISSRSRLERDLEHTCRIACLDQFQPGAFQSDSRVSRSTAGTFSGPSSGDSTRIIRARHELRRGLAKWLRTE